MFSGSTSYSDRAIETVTSAPVSSSSSSSRYQNSLINYDGYSSKHRLYGNKAMSIAQWPPSEAPLTTGYSEVNHHARCDQENMYTTWSSMNEAPHYNDRMMNVDELRSDTSDLSCYTRSNYICDLGDSSSKGSRESSEYSDQTCETGSKQQVINSYITPTPLDGELQCHMNDSLLSMVSTSIDEDDEDARRRRRRERNKLAACKCRYKKRQHVAFLVSESERLERHNESLQLSLEQVFCQLEQLSHMMNAHDCRYIE